MAGPSPAMTEVPKEATIAPLDWYMLFIVDHHGVPSVAKWVLLTRP